MLKSMGIFNSKKCVFIVAFNGEVSLFIGLNLSICLSVYPYSYPYRKAKFKNITPTDKNNHWECLSSRQRFLLKRPKIFPHNTLYWL